MRTWQLCRFMTDTSTTRVAQFIVVRKLFGFDPDFDNVLLVNERCTVVCTLVDY